MGTTTNGSTAERGQVNGRGHEVLLLTMVDAARVLSVGRTTMYELVGAGEIEVVHIGRCRSSAGGVDRGVRRATPPTAGYRSPRQQVRPGPSANLTRASRPPDRRQEADIMSVHRRATSRGARYDVRLRSPDGRNYKRTFRSRREADAYEARELADRSRGAWIDPEAVCDDVRGLGEVVARERQRQTSEDAGAG